MPEYVGIITIGQNHQEKKGKVQIKNLTNLQRNLDTKNGYLILKNKLMVIITLLQPINANREKYIGKIFDIHLYSINDDTKERWWLGKIKNVEIVSYEEESKIYNFYKRKVG